MEGEYRYLIIWHSQKEMNIRFYRSDIIKIFVQTAYLKSDPILNYIFNVTLNKLYKVNMNHNFAEILGYFNVK